MRISYQLRIGKKRKINQTRAFKGPFQVINWTHNHQNADLFIWIPRRWHFVAFQKDKIPIENDPFIDSVVVVVYFSFLSGPMIMPASFIISL